MKRACLILALSSLLHAEETGDPKRAANTVVLTGDNHANWVNDLRTDDLRPETPLVATEFAGTSISSGGRFPR